MLGRGCPGRAESWYGSKPGAQRRKTWPWANDSPSAGRNQLGGEWGEAGRQGSLEDEK